MTVPAWLVFLPMFAAWYFEQAAATVDSWELDLPRDQP